MDDLFVKELKSNLGSIKKKIKDIEEQIKLFESDADMKAKKIPKGEIHVEILNHWNSKGFKKHRMNSKIRTHVNARLRDYSVDDIKAMIDTYADIVKSDQYWYNHIFAVWDFLKYGYSKFVDDETAKGNFKIENSSKSYVENREGEWEKVGEW